jgi:hypothetical protein
MAGDPITPETTLAIVMGASEYRFADLEPLPAAANAAVAFLSYLTSKEGLNLPVRNVLDVFDSDKSPRDIDAEIAGFLKRRQDALKQKGLSARDLILYYVGHGGFTAGDQGYFLALRTTVKDHEGTSGLRMVDLAGTLSKSARDLRRFLILDCCFAGSADGFFQMSSPAESMRRKTLESFPRRGTALLCASSASNVALAPSKQPYTMFSGVLLDVLRKGRLTSDAAFSLNQVGAEVREGIQTQFTNEAVRPKVSSPDEREGDIADIPLFPNPGWQAGAVVIHPTESSAVAPSRASKAQVTSVLHLAVGIISFSLPCALALGRIILGERGDLPSLSSYYYSGMHNVFVAGFSAIGVFILSGLGHDADRYGRRDQIGLAVTALLWIGFALVPGMQPTQPTETGKILGMVHFLIVVLLFLMLSYICLVLYPLPAGAIATSRERERNQVYRICGYVILVCILLAVGSGLLPVVRMIDLKPVFWLESMVMIAFGMASLTKGAVILRDLRR